MLSVAIVADRRASALSLPVLAVLVAIMGCFTVLFEVSYQSVVPGIVPSPHLATANARLQATTAVAQIGGPGLGGLLVQLLTAPFAMLADTLAYVVSAVAIGRIRTPETPPGRTATFAVDLRDGLRYVAGDRYLIANLGFSALYNPFAQWIMVLFTLHAVHTLGLDAAEIGLVLADRRRRRAARLAARRGGRCVASVPASRSCGALRSSAPCCSLIPLADASWGHALVIPIARVGIRGQRRRHRRCRASSSSPSASCARPTACSAVSMRACGGSPYGTIALGAAAGGLVGELVGTQRWPGDRRRAGLVTVVWVALSPLVRIGDPADLAIEERRAPAPPMPAASIAGLR